MKKLVCLLLTVCLLLVPFVSANAAENGEVETSLGEETAGDMRMSMTLDAYFSMRNDTFSGEAAVMAQCESTLAAVSANNELTAKNLQRLAAPKELAEYHSIHITDTSVSYQIESVTETEPSIYEVEVYEWTWVYYNDGRGGPIDDMGFGTDHAMVLRRLDDGRYVIISDDYDDSDIMGPHDHTKAPVSEMMEDSEETVPMNYDSVNFNAGLNVDALVEYADKWVKHIDNPKEDDYFPSYYNNTEYTYYDFNDCANYVSQCLKAGGMENDYTSNYPWWYESSGEPPEANDYTPCSRAWREVTNFINYWKSCGFEYAVASSDTVFRGNPVITNNEGHVAICVGYNSQGEPWFNGHSYDRYHYVYSLLGGTCKTFQIIKMKHDVHAFMYTGKNLSSHICKCLTCGLIRIEKHEWVKKNDYYVCSICSMTSPFIPIQPVGNLLGTPLTQETAEK